jgi:hypothetical protein
MALPPAAKPRELVVIYREKAPNSQIAFDVTLQYISGYIKQGAIAAIAYRPDGIFALHDLRESAADTGDLAYHCSCSNCVNDPTYVINRKEANVAIMTVGVATLGSPSSPMAQFDPQARPAEPTEGAHLSGSRLQHAPRLRLRHRRHHDDLRRPEERRGEG